MNTDSVRAIVFEKAVTFETNFHRKEKKKEFSVMEKLEW